MVDKIYTYTYDAGFNIIRNNAVLNLLMMTLPRYASVLETSESQKHIDNVAFFQSISQLDVCNESSFHNFMRSYRNVCIKVVGVSDAIRFCDIIPDSPEFDQFSVDLWKQYYIQEGIVQVALLEDKQPLEVMFLV